jgi:eukaryotic-like serine/threonine-protein kinase
MKGAELLANALAAQYRIDSLLGEGGMATVYRAFDLKHHREVALKVLRPDLAGSPGRERFLREIRLAARLNHPHILPLYDSGEAGPFVYFVMPVVRGQTLRARLAREKILPVAEALRIATEVADALDYAHRQGVVHRDVKPENILMHEGHAVVADFGVGKALAAVSSEMAMLTKSGVTLGTPAYMSPEQAVGEPIDGRCDLFALGCVLYEMLSGEAAFTGLTTPAVIARRFMGPPPRLAELRPDVPPVVDGVVARLLEKSPAARYASGAAVIDALRSPDPAALPVSIPIDKSLVVLPFTTPGAEPENEYFAEGLAEELIADLAQVRALRVISRTSSMQLKGTTKRLRDIGRELGVRYALEGGIRKVGDLLRITAQLVDTHTDTRLWADKYAGAPGDVFELQERVSRAIVQALDVTLSSDEDARLTDRPLRNVRALELFFRARQEIRRYQMERAAPLLEQAVAIEGEVPALRALRALALILQVRAGLHPDKQPLDTAEAEARALVRVSPEAAYGHALLGFIGVERGALREAVRSLRAAMARDPTDADVQFYLGFSLVCAGQIAEAAALSRRLMADDPLSVVAPTLAGVVSWYTGRPAEGLESSQRAVEMDPESLLSHWTLGYHYALLGRFADAGRHATVLAQRAPAIPSVVQLRALLDASDGLKRDARERLSAVNVEAVDGHMTFHIAEAFAMAGDSVRALELLARAVDRGFYAHEFIGRLSPFVEPLRRIPEFYRIVAAAERRVGEFTS